MSTGKLAAQISADAAFFDSMVHMIPASYYHGGGEQTTDSKFTHSKATKVQPRQAFKEGSKQAQKQKAKFDPKNYTSVLATNGKAQNGADSDEDMEDDDEDEEEDDEDDDAEDDENEDDEDDEPEQPAPKRKQPAGKSAAAAASSPSLSSAPTPAAAASASTSLPAPPLSSLSADVGMDQLRQRLHERINGLNTQRKPQEHPFAKKRQKPDAKALEEKKKRQKNEQRPSTHRGIAKPLHPRDDDAGSAPSSAKKQKTSASASPSSSNGAAVSNGLRESDIADSNDFQFAALKPIVNPAAKSGSFSLQGKQQRKKNPKDAEVLREVEAFESKVESLRAAGDKEEAHRVESARALDNALLRAQGVRVKDDAKLLRKSLKRDEKKRNKSAAEWSERTAAQKSTQDAFHKDKIARASKKGNHDRSKHQAADEGAKGAKGIGSSKAKAKAGAAKSGDGKRAGFEGGKKKFLN